MLSSEVLSRIVGYGLLLFAVADDIGAIIPCNSSSLLWQFQTAGGFVEHAMVPLIGFVLVFYGDSNNRRKQELSLLKILSWSALSLSALYLSLTWIFLVVPPAMNSQAESQLKAQVDARVSEMKKLRSQIESSTPAEIDAFMKNRGISNFTPADFKAKMIRDNQNSQQQFEEQSETAKATQQLVLIKNVVKWEIGSIISALLFFRIWQETEWARKK